MEAAETGMKAKKAKLHFLSRAILKMVFVHIAERQEFNLCKPLSAV